MPTTFDTARAQGLVPWDALVADLDDTLVFRDGYPVVAGHLLFVPRYDSVDQIALAFRCAELWGQALVQAGECDGYNIGINRGSSAGQTVMYPHVHLIPRRSGDTPDPVGGVRGVIPGQANYRKMHYKNPNNK